MEQLRREEYAFTMTRSMASFLREALTADEIFDAWCALPDSEYPNMYRISKCAPLPFVLLTRIAADAGMPLADLAHDVETLLAVVPDDADHFDDHMYYRYANPHKVDPFIHRMAVRAFMHLNTLFLFGDSEDAAELDKVIARIREHREALGYPEAEFDIDTPPLVRIDDGTPSARVAVIGHGKLHAHQIRAIAALDAMTIGMSLDINAGRLEHVPSDIRKRSLVVMPDLHFSCSAIADDRPTRGATKAFLQSLRDRDSQKHRAAEARGRKYLKRK